MSDFSYIDALNVKNKDSQFNADNFRRVGNFVLVSPLAAVGALILPADWVGLGYFRPDAQLAPTTDVQRSPILVQNPQGGQPITLLEDTTDVSAIYETIEPVTADEYIQALHQGSVPVALTDATLNGSTISPFEPGASIEARMMVIRITEGSAATKRYELFWHPRVALQSNGLGDYEGRATRIFRVPVRQWGGQFEADGVLAAFGNAKGDMGAVFQGPINELAALVTALKGEAAAA